MSETATRLEMAWATFANNLRKELQYHNCKICNRRYSAQFLDTNSRQTIVAKCIQCGDIMRIASAQKAESK